MQVRRATAKDAPALAELIYGSAPTLLSAIFDIDTEFNAKQFLADSLQQAEGQYGYHNHWVSENQKRVVACVSAWHTDLAETFHQATLRSITQFYGLEQALAILRANQVIVECIPEIAIDEWCIGHVSVTPSFRKQGYANGLITAMAEQAISMNKTALCLDVEASNQLALDFYIKQGFVVFSESANTTAMQKLAIGVHLRLVKQLS